LTNTNPLLGPLASNGGPTQAMALLPGSPAINAGVDFEIAELTTDQRGFPRWGNGAVDSGAFEVTPVYSAAGGDFDGDGTTDLALANFLTHTVSVLRGNGDGSFTPTASYAVGNGPTSVAMGDFDGDGDLDLAVANFIDGSISVLLNNGDGTFASAVNSPLPLPVIPFVGANPLSVVAGDFNVDGTQDLAVAYALHNVSVLRNNGGGNLAVVWSTNHGGRGFLATGDFDLDGVPDLAVTDFGGAISFLAGASGGDLAPVILTGAVPRSIVVGDFNEDGYPDLAMANSGSANVSVLLGGIGGFAPAANYPVGVNPLSVVVGDFNGDGHQDLAVANASGGVSVLPGNGDGSFALPVNFSVGTDALFAVAGNFVRRTATSEVAVVNVQSGQVTTISLPSVSISPMGIDFGDVYLGSPQSKKVTIKNTGTALIALGKPTLTLGPGAGTDDFTFVNLCGSTLTAGKKCTVVVTAIADQVGSFTDALNIIAAETTWQVNLSANVINPIVALTPSSRNFGTVKVGTPSPEKIIKLKNIGTTTLAISNIALTGGAKADYSMTKTCGSSLAPDATCTVSVIFNPLAAGTRSAAVTFTDNARTKTQSVPLSGTGR
jgi:hypothetical protein